MKKILYSDWLTAVQLFFLKNSAEKSSFSAKRGDKPSILIGQRSKKLADDQSNLWLSNQACTLDCTI